MPSLSLSASTPAPLEVTSVGSLRIFLANWIKAGFPVRLPATVLGTSPLLQGIGEILRIHPVDQGFSAVDPRRLHVSRSSWKFLGAMVGHGDGKRAALTPHPPFGRRQDLHLDLSLVRRSNRDLQLPNFFWRQLSYRDFCLPAALLLSYSDLSIRAGLAPATRWFD
jgi:hypothetical protein